MTGFEAKTRTDWRVTSNTDGADDVADAELQAQRAERQSGADRACSDAFRPQLCVGIGWVEVARESDPFITTIVATPSIAMRFGGIFWPSNPTCLMRAI